MSPAWPRPSPIWAYPSICPAWRADYWGSTTRGNCVISAGPRSKRPTSCCWPACLATSGWTTAITSGASAVYITANRSKDDLNRNRKPDIGVHADPGIFLQMLATTFGGARRWEEWTATLRGRDDVRNAEIAAQAAEPTDHINPLYLCRELDGVLRDNTILVADGGDFVATAAYTVSHRGPLTWLDPGPFGTLGVGAGFALGAKLVHPEADVWIIYGDGSVGYSIAEFDTFVRHKIPVIAVVGNDAGWSQIAREQVAMLGDDVGTVLAPSDYHIAAAGLGALGFKVDDPELAGEVLERARAVAKSGKPVLVNAILGKSDFRKGSLSM